MLEEQEKQCKDCKPRIETFANGQSTSSDVSINPLILAILTLIIVILAFLIHQYLKWYISIDDFPYLTNMQSLKSFGNHIQFV